MKIVGVQFSFWIIIFSYFEIPWKEQNVCSAINAFWLPSPVCCSQPQTSHKKGVAVAQEMERVIYWLEGSGSIPSSSSLHVDVSLAEILNPKLLPMWICVCVSDEVGSFRRSPCHSCISVCVWMGECLLYCKALWMVESLKKCYTNAIPLKYIVL